MAGQWPPMATSGQGKPGKKRVDAMASGGALLYDLMIIRKQQRKKKSIAEQWRVHRSEQRGNGEAYHTPGSRGHDMARQCSRVRNNCKSKEVVGVTPMSSSPPQAQHPGDDGTGDATASTAPVLSPDTREHRQRCPHHAGDHISSEVTSLHIQHEGDLEQEVASDESTLMDRWSVARGVEHERRRGQARPD
jgi:hypothetical protein